MRVKMNIIPSKFMFLANQFHVSQVESVILVGVTHTEKEVYKNNGRPTEQEVLYYTVRTLL